MQIMIIQEIILKSPKIHWLDVHQNQATKHLQIFICDMRPNKCACMKVFLKANNYSGIAKVFLSNDFFKENAGIN